MNVAFYLIENSVQKMRRIKGRKFNYSFTFTFIEDMPLSVRRKKEKIHTKRRCTMLRYMNFFQLAVTAIHTFICTYVYIVLVGRNEIIMQFTMKAH